MDRHSGASRRGWNPCVVMVLLVAATAMSAVGLAGLLGSISNPRARRTPVGRDYSANRLDVVGYLRDVAEPITMLDGISWSDGGSMGLLFRDSRQVVRAACLAVDLEDHHELTFGEMTPNLPAKVPVGGAEEKAFLGLLQRWARDDPRARACRRRMDDGTGSWVGEYRSGKIPKEEYARYFAIALLRDLEARN